MAVGIYKKVQNHLKEYYVQGCVAIHRDAIFILHQYGGDDASGVCLSYYTQSRKNVWSASCFGPYYRSSCCALSDPDSKLISVGWDGGVITHNGFEESGAPLYIEEDPIPLLGNCPIGRIRNIQGKAYIAAAWRTVFRREARNQWTLLSGNDPQQVEQLQQESRETSRDFGFNDIGGFAGNDIYACGGDGDPWHYDGQRWTPLDCPTNAELTALCCAPDGNVYIGCDDGRLLRGRGDQWQLLRTGIPRIKIADLVWYQGKLYLACGLYGLYVHDGERTRRAPGIGGLGSALSAPTERLHEETRAILEQAGADREAIELADSLSPTEDILCPASLHSLSTDGKILAAAGTDKVVVLDDGRWKLLYIEAGFDLGGEL